ncbi:MAG: hypothetical protein GEV03_04090 [Streptosporangiales bacterium]|nr:hypothetical protein [Streptosporangiales bacterium]
MHDAIQVEGHDIPGVAICTEPFSYGAAQLAKMRGAEGFRFAVVEHPLGSLGDDDLWHRAEAALPQVVDIATGSR